VTAPAPPPAPAGAPGSTEPRPASAEPRPAWLAPALAYAVVIFYLSSLPNPLPALTGRLWDKVLHTVEYGVLAALLTLGLDHVLRRGPWRTAALAAALASLYGATDELHQAFVPHRSCELRDWAADTVGALVGAALAAVCLRLWRPGASIRA